MTAGMRERPNIIFILMDDMGYGDMGCYGSRLIKTPVFDSIAAEGVRFTQIYSAPICSPARCQVMTGRYAQRVGISRVLFPWDSIGLGSSQKSVAEYLKECGYATSCIGKWHLGCREEHYPTRHGFDRFFGLLYSNDMNPLCLYRDEDIIEDQVDQARLTERYTDEAINFIMENKDRPFFCYLAHTMPHIPLHVPEEWRGRSQAGTYGDTIECIDYHTGRILDVLRECGIEEKTLLIVTSDNGPWYEGNTGPLRGRKFEVYEGGIRMPFVARWKGVIPAGITNSEPVGFIDLLPTFVALAGGKVPENSIDGKDISSLFKGEGKTPHEALFYYYCDSLNAVRAGRWKLHIAQGTGKQRNSFGMPQLFDMENDEGENYNLADRHPDIVRRLTEMIEDFDRETRRIAGIESEV